MIIRLIRQPQPRGGDPDDVLTRILKICHHVNLKKGGNTEICMKFPQNSMGIPIVKIEGTKDIPTTKVIDDFKKGFFSVRFNVFQ